MWCYIIVNVIVRLIFTFLHNCGGDGGGGGGDGGGGSGGGDGDHYNSCERKGKRK